MGFELHPTGDPHGQWGREGTMDSPPSLFLLHSPRTNEAPRLGFGWGGGGSGSVSPRTAALVWMGAAVTHGGSFGAYKVSAVCVIVGLFECLRSTEVSQKHATATPSEKL